jgi:secretion/DNA translocation related TadE-like protein
MSRDDEGVWARRRRLGEMLRRWAGPGARAPGVARPPSPARSDAPEPKGAQSVHFSHDSAQPGQATEQAGSARGDALGSPADVQAEDERRDARGSPVGELAEDERRDASGSAAGELAEDVRRDAPGSSAAELAQDERRDAPGSPAGGLAEDVRRDASGGRRDLACRGGNPSIWAWVGRLSPNIRGPRRNGAQGGGRGEERKGDRGAATIFVLAIGLVLVSAGVAGAAVGSARIGRHRAQAAADLGALAGAARAVEGTEAACRQAARFVNANSVQMTSCEVRGLEIVVRTNVTIAPMPGLSRHAQAAARAGPVYAMPF